MKRPLNLILFMLVLHAGTKAGTSLSITSGNWSSASTWLFGNIPGAGDDVIIATSNVVTVTANASCASVTIGNALINGATTLTINTGVTLNVSGNISITAPLLGSNDNTLNVNAGIVNCNSLSTANPALTDKRCIVNISTGTLNCSGNFLMANNTACNKLIFSSAGLLQIGGNASTLLDAQFTASTSTVDYKATGNQNILPLSYYNLKGSGSGIKSLTSNLTLSGSLQIAGTAQLDVNSSNNYSLNVAGNWTITSTNTNPFIEQRGTVTLNGSGGTQTLSTTLSQESFYNLTINNTAGNSAADIIFSSSCYVSQTYTHTNGKLNLSGNNLTVVSVNSTGSFINCNLSGGSIISTTAGALVSFADNNDSTYVNFTGTGIGSSAYPVTLTINTGRINLQNLHLYGTGSFTKTFPIDDASSTGGNKFYNDVSFTASAAASRWSMGNGNTALPDSFFAKSTFNANANGGANNNFVLGANSLNNYYADSVTFTSSTAGGIYIGKNSGASAGKQSSHYFNGHVEITVTGTGNLSFADGSSSLPAAVSFNKTIKLNSGSGATGSIYIGENVSGSSISFTTNGQLQDGTISGANSIYFYNVTQSGTLSQTTVNGAATNSSIVIGSNTSPCTWNGSLTLTAPAVNLAYSNFNGSTNTFTTNGTVSNQSCTGGNTFGSSSTTYFNNSGTMIWYLSVTAPDDFNGNAVFYAANSTGLFPAYNTNCTFAGNITVDNASDSIIFAASTNGRVIIDGNSGASFFNNGSKGATMKRITLNKTSGNFTLNKNIGVPTGGDITLTASKFITAANALIYLMDESCTITTTTSASSSYIDGPMRYDVSSTASQSLHFPVGKGNYCRPVQLNIKHNAATSYSYTAEVVNSNANALGWNYPSSVYDISTSRWWDIERTVTATGAAASSTNLETSPSPVITLFYGADDNVTSVADLTVCKNTTGAPTSWIDIGATGATLTTGSVSSTSSPAVFNSFSRFCLGYYGIPQAPSGSGNSRCGTGTINISATPVAGEYIDWYAAASGGTALATAANNYTTPSIPGTTVYYAEARNTVGYVSTTRTAVTATVNDTATVSSFLPVTGITGTPVVLTGLNFTGATAVSFGGTAASSFTINSNTQITATVAAGATGQVTVTNGCGNGSKPGFTFIYITTWTGAVNSTWTNAANWNNNVPTNMYTAIIPNVSNVPLVTSNQYTKSLIVNNSASLDIAVGNTISVIDSFTNNGTIIGSGAILLNGTAAQTIDGNGTMTNLRLNNTAGATIVNTTGNMVNITGRYTPSAGVLTTNDKMTLKSNASGSGAIAPGASAGGYINGKITIERFIPGRRAWRLIGFPITATGAPTINESLQEGAGGYSSSDPNPGYGIHITGGSVANGFDQNSVNNPSMKEWNGTAWQGISTTNQSVTNQDVYLLFVRGSRSNNLSQLTAASTDNTIIRVTGNAKQGNQLIPITGTGWQAVANPFPAAINLYNIATANSSLINNNFVFWDPKLGGTNNVGGYVTASYNGSSYDYTPDAASTLSESAQLCSVFLVDAKATGNLGITEANKCNCSSDNVFRPQGSAQPSKLRINLHSFNSDGTTPLVDGTLAVYDNAYSNELDQYDPVKLLNTGAESFFIKKDGKRLSIERRNTIKTTDTIQLGFSGIKLRSYRLEINGANFNQDSVIAYLEDSYTAVQTPLNLTTSTAVDFTITNEPANYNSSRFRIIFKKLLPAVLPVTISSIKATMGKSSNKNVVNVQWVTATQVNINHYQVERAADGIHFSTIGTVNALNEDARVYNFVDRQPLLQAAYYRVKAIESNAAVQFSKTVKLYIGKQAGVISLYQNPVKNNTVLLQISGQTKGKYHIEVFDKTGKRLAMASINHDGVNCIKSVKLKNHLPHCIYHISVNGEDGYSSSFNAMVE
ncbi:MAG: hypothetical protein QM791_02425 [Ferruginibacter sp.]